MIKESKMVSKNIFCQLNHQIDNKLTIILLALLAIFYFGHGTASASAVNIIEDTDASVALDNIEDLLLEWDKNGTRKLTEYETELLPYLIYVDMLEHMSARRPINSASNKEVSFDYINHQFKEADSLRSLIITKAALDYQARYGHHSRPTIKKTEIAEYEKRADGGDLEAMFELRRYYENPAIGADYNPNQTEARFWLLKAVEAGSEQAIYDLGYEEPYIAETTLFAGGLNATVHVACDKLHSSTTSGSAIAGCFLYMLSIENRNVENVQPQLDDKDNWSPQFRNNLHFVYVNYFLKKNALKPKKFAIIQSGKDIFIEIISYGEDSDTHLRKDFFSSDGTYMGSNGHNGSQITFLITVRHQQASPKLFSIPQISKF